MKPAISLAALLAFASAADHTPANEEKSEYRCADPVSGAALVAGWNERILKMAVAEDRLLTLKGVRTAAMTHVAMHDAINTIQPRYQRYVLKGEPVEADPFAAAAQAAFEVAVDQYPDQRRLLLQDLKHWLACRPDGSNESRGIELGKRAARGVLAARKGDGWNTEAEYMFHPMAPGVYAEFPEHSDTPEGFVFGAGWAEATPFMLPSADYFRVPPPPEIGSDAYTDAFNEVKDVGSYKSKTRTADQSHLAMWWKDFIENSSNRLARALVKKEALDLWEASRLFALLNMSVFDAYVSVFNNKFHYNHWRPYTAIRWADKDGNPDTEVDPDWNNLHRHTYAFPSYPSAHGTACGAAMTVLADTFENDYAFTMVTRKVDAAGPLGEKVEMHPPDRSFEDFASAAHECAMSRLYLGIHFRYDSIQGEKLGKRIGHYAVNGFLQPLKSK